MYRYIRVNTLAVALASKDNTMVKPPMYLRRNSEKDHLGSNEIFWPGHEQK
jgi:hypothetical protein